MLCKLYIRIVVEVVRYRVGSVNKMLKLDVKNYFNKPAQILIC